MAASVGPKEAPKTDIADIPQINDLEQSTLDLVNTFLKGQTEQFHAVQKKALSELSAKDIKSASSSLEALKKIDSKIKKTLEKVADVAKKSDVAAGPAKSKPLQTQWAHEYEAKLTEHARVIQSLNAQLSDQTIQTKMVKTSSFEGESKAQQETIKRSSKELGSELRGDIEVLNRDINALKYQLTRKGPDPAKQSELKAKQELFECAKELLQLVEHPDSQKKAKICGRLFTFNPDFHPGSKISEILDSFEKLCLFAISILVPTEKASDSGESRLFEDLVNRIINSADLKELEEIKGDLQKIKQSEEFAPAAMTQLEKLFALKEYRVNSEMYESATEQAERILAKADPSLGLASIDAQKKALKNFFRQISGNPMEKELTKDILRKELAKLWKVDEKQLAIEKEEIGAQEKPLKKILKVKLIDTKQAAKQDDINAIKQLIINSKVTKEEITSEEQEDINELAHLIASLEVPKKGLKPLPTAKKADIEQRDRLVAEHDKLVGELRELYKKLRAKRMGTAQLEIVSDVDPKVKKSKDKLTAETREINKQIKQTKEAIYKKAGQIKDLNKKIYGKMKSKEQVRFIKGYIEKRKG